MDLFTVDRRRSLSNGFVCKLIEHGDISPREISDLCMELCPGGVSFHGELYLVRNERSTSVTDANTEIIFELVRRAKYPNRPSRYQSLYALDDLETARQFMDITGANGSPVYKVESEDSFRADMHLLDSRMSAIVKTYFANLYWQGLPHPALLPFWERLVPCPVTIGEQIE